MKKAVSGQIIGAEVLTAADGTAFTGAVTVYYTLDGGTQTIGSVGSGVCTHEGNGFHSYTPTSGETDGDHIAWTFIGTAAVPVTIQVFTGFPQSVDNADALSSLANVGSAVNRPAASYTLTTGTQSANTYTATEALDGTNHEHTDDTGVLDLYYEFNVGAGLASSVHVTGYVNGNNDDVDVYGYDWVAAAWVQIGNIDGTAQSNNQVNSFDMFVTMVGSGVDSGIVRVRLYKAAGLTSATLAIDQIFIAFNQATEGYQNAAIWIDTTASNTNTVKDIDGTATNPVSTMGAVNILLASTNLRRIEAVSGSAVTLSATQNNQVFSGDNWTLAMGGQDISGTTFIGAHTSGIASGVGTEQTFKRCHLETMTHIKETHFIECGVSGTQTVGEAGDYFFDRCHSAIAGTTTWIWDFGAAVGSTNLNWRNGSGGIQLENMGTAGTDTASIEGRGQIIEGTCTGGMVAVRGSFTTSGITNLTLVDGARYESSELVGLTWSELMTGYTVNNSAGKILRELKENPQYEGGFIYFDSVGGAAGNEAYINGTLDNPVNNEADLLTLKAALNIHQVKIRSGSTLTLSAAHEKQEYIGEAWSLNLAGQSISASFFHGATSVNGTGTGATPPKFSDCTINNVTLPPSSYHKCGFAGIFTVGSAGDFFFVGDSHSAVAGVGTPSFSYGVAIGVTNFNFRGYHGGQNVKDMTTGDNLSFDGDGQIIIDSSSGPGVMRIAGHQKMTGAGAFLAAGGTISDDARFATDQLPSILQSTTIATLTSQTVFTLTAGSTAENTYNNALIIITDASTAELKAVATVISYVGATKGITLESDPGIFTMAVGDKIDILSNSSTAALINAVITEKVDTLMDINKPQELVVSTTTTLQYQWLDTEGDAVNISALTFIFKAVQNAGDVPAAIPEVTGTITDGPNGRWSFDVLPTTVFKGRYEIWADDGAGIITPLTMAGGVRIETHPRL